MRTASCSRIDGIAKNAARPTPTTTPTATSDTRLRRSRFTTAATNTYAAPTGAVMTDTAR